MNQLKFTSFTQITLFITILFVFGCKNFSVIEGRRGGKSNTPSSRGSATSPHQTDLPSDDTEDSIESTPLGETGETPPSETLSRPSKPNIIPPEPKIGVIVGPGFLRSFLAVGILQEFQKARIPIQALVGFEWGSLPAGLYASNGQANEMEWQMLKLNENNVIKKSLIRNQVEPHSTAEMRDFLQKAFSQRSFEQTRIPFECLTFDLKKKQYFWMKKGDMASAMAYCLASPPFSKPYLNNIGAYDLKLASESLKKKGANYIVFINTFSANKDLSDDSFSPEAHVLWTLEEYQLLNTTGSIDFVIDTSSAPFKMMDYDSRRDMIRAGQDIGQRAIKKLTAKLKI